MLVRPWRSTVAVMYDPYSGYADQIMHRLWGDFGVRTVVLHTRWRERLIREGRLPVLRSPLVAAHYMVPAGGVVSLAGALRSAHRVVAVVPHDEGSVAPLARLADLLGLDWAQPDVLPLFRNKAALKAAVARADPALRLNRVRLVGDPEDVRQWLREEGVRRYVLKPNDGSGNRDVAFLDTDDGPDVVAGWLARTGTPALVEEYVDGEEYKVNGQVDESGTPIVTGIGRYRRMRLNDRPNLELGSRSLSSSDPPFAMLRDYAVRVVRATGLRRSPFHLEAKVDEQGPCLIEVAARLCGDLGVLVDAWQHGPGADFVGAALFGYLTDEPYGPLPLDWRRHDLNPVARVNGVSTMRERIARVDGLDEVEAMPGFLGWVKRPEVGATVVRTESLVTKPWCLDVTAPTESALDEVEEGVRRAIRLVGESQPLSAAERAALYGARVSKYWRARPRTSLLRTRTGR